MLLAEVAANKVKKDITELFKPVKLCCKDIEYIMDKASEDSPEIDEANMVALESNLQEWKNECAHVKNINLSIIKTAASEAKKAYNKLQKEKSKADLDVRNHIEHLILVAIYKLDQGAYHGGQYNGVCAREFMEQAATIFMHIIDLLLSYEHPSKQAKDTEIKESCGLLSRTLQQLVLAFSILCKPHATPTENDYEKLEEAIKE
eukprot:11470023-Ditylum_brightwellii.AAC.1